MSQTSGMRSGPRVAWCLVTTTQTPVVAGSGINGAAVRTGGRPFPVINPATGEVGASYALATPADVDAAVAAARAAQPGWARATPAERAAVLGKLAELMDANAATFVAEE